MNVLIRAGLSNPPSSLISFRELTMILHFASNVEILIESEKDSIDHYYKWLKPMGAMDFVEDILEPGVEKGFRIDTQRRFPSTAVVVDRLISDNVVSIAGQVGHFIEAAKMH